MALSKIVVDELLTTYLQLGNDQAQLVLILPGWGDDSRGWMEFGQALSDNYLVVALDLPGFGGTDRPSSAWGLDDYAAFVGDFMRKLQLKPYAVIGHSNGGAIAIRGLAAGDFDSDKLVLLASAGVRSHYKGRKKALRLIAKTGKLLVKPLPETIKHRLRRKLYTTVGSDMLVVESMQETFKRIVNDDVLADASTLTMPTLLLYGEQDVATPPTFGRLLHERLAVSTLEIIGDAEHFVHNDQPTKVQTLVRGFLE